MYLPRHYSQEKHKSIFQWKYFIIFILVALAVFVFFYRKDIIKLFYSSRLAKISKLDEEITQKNLDSQMNIQYFNKYFSAISSFAESDPTNSFAYFLMAKSFYYKVLYEGLKFDTTNLIMLLSNNYIKVFQENPKIGKNIENMYQSALRAKAFSPKFEQQTSNTLMIHLYQTLTNQRDAHSIDKEISQIQYIHLSQEFILPFIWIGILNSTRAGNFESLERFLQINEKVKSEFRILISNREISFLKGFITFHLNDYITALKYFRESKDNLDLVTIESIKKESEIFYKQNLPQKSVQVLEELYKETGQTDKDILVRIRFILQNKPGIVTSLLKEINNLETTDE